MLSYSVLDANVVDVEKRRNPSKHYVSGGGARPSPRSAAGQADCLRGPAHVCGRRDGTGTGARCGAVPGACPAGREALPRGAAPRLTLGRAAAPGQPWLPARSPRLPLRGGR